MMHGDTVFTIFYFHSTIIFVVYYEMARDLAVP